jgi:hypothetical protein
MKRRKFINIMSTVSLTSVVVPQLAFSQEGNPSVMPAGDSDDNEVEYLFVQTAHQCGLADGQLTLLGVAPSTLYFSDRPERIVGHAPTENFPVLWEPGEDSFLEDPPNAALSVFSGSDAVEIVVVLKSPKLNEDRLVYTVDVLEGQDTFSGGACSLFIDVIGRPASPASVAGVHRRNRRRVRRVVR